MAATLFVGAGAGEATPEAPRAPAQTSINPGAANANAQTLKINPRAGSLSVGITEGISLADYQNHVARAESRSIDLGIIGDLLAQTPCSGGNPTLPEEQQPQPVRAEARGEPQSTGQVPEDKAGGAIIKFAEATPQPFSRAVTTTAAQDIIPGLFSIGGGRSETITRFVDGVRESIAITEIGSLSIANVIELTGLRWEAVHRSGATEEHTGSFTIGGGTLEQLSILGNLLGDALQLPTDPILLLDTIGQVLKPLGVSLVMPRSYEAGGWQFVDPLKIGFVPSEVRDGLLGAVLNLLQPVRQPLVERLFEIECRTEDVITVADIAVGSLSGTGDFHLELGGVQATSRDISTTCFLCPTTGGPGSGPVALPPSAPSTPATPIQTPRVLPSTPTAALTPEAPAAAPSEPATERRTQPTSGLGERGGALALVALIGLGLLAAVAEGDRRKMRKAQRLIPVEA